MKKRAKISRKYSKKLFTRTAKGVHPRNSVRAMRGGIRL